MDTAMAKSRALASNWLTHNTRVLSIALPSRWGGLPICPNAAQHWRTADVVQHGPRGCLVSAIAYGRLLSAVGVGVWS